MKTLALLLLLPLGLSAQLCEFTTRAEGGGYYRVLVNDSATTQHTQVEEAMAQAFNRKAERPSATVVIVHNNYRRHVDVRCSNPPDTTTPPDTIAPPPPDTIPPPSGDATWSDDFDGGGVAPDGYAWLGNPANVQVVEGTARSGTHAMRFHFPGKVSGLDATAEKRFQFGDALTEVWLRYYVFLPLNYQHRNDTGPDNNKWLRIWGSDYNASNKVGTSTLPSADGSNMIVEFGQNEGAIGNYNKGGANPFITAAHLGRWVEFRYHAKLASGPDANNGVQRIWWDGALVYENTALDQWSTATNWWDHGYLFGWANSGFAQDTDIYLDDIEVHTVNPGW